MSETHPYILRGNGGLAVSRKGSLCRRVNPSDKRPAVEVEFEDGSRIVVNRMTLRRAKEPAPAEK